MKLKCIRYYGMEVIVASGEPEEDVASGEPEEDAEE